MSNSKVYETIETFHIQAITQDICIHVMFFLKSNIGFRFFKKYNLINNKTKTKKTHILKINNSSYRYYNESVSEINII